ncbi:MAG: hypothetical protein AABX12_03575, partial [Nanoarchaeota archaeon]
MSKLKFVLCFALIVVIISVQASAMGITPGRTTLKYEPGAEQTVGFKIINSEKEDFQAVILVQGELNASIALSEVSFDMTAGEAERAVSYTFKAPPSLTPGTRSAEIVVMKLPKKSGSGATFVGAAVGVVTQLHVLVPYPGKYADIDMNVAGPDGNGQVTFLIPVVSRGDLDLVDVRATVDIYTSLNEKIDSVSTGRVSIASGQRNELVGVWDSKNFTSGAYKAVVTVLYDEQAAKMEKVFEIGSRTLELQQVEVNEFSLGDIAKFELLVENKWNQPITGAFAQMQIFNNDKQVMADFKSANYDIPALSKALMVAFWDTKGVKEGTYDSSVFLRYGEHSGQKDLQLKVSTNEINVIGLGYVISQDKKSGSSGSSSALVTVLVIVIALLVLVNLAWFLVLRKKLKR